MIKGVANKAFKKLQKSIAEHGDSPVMSKVRGVKDLSKEDYLNALDKLKGRDRIGVTGEVLATSIAGAGGVAAAGTIASAAGASTLLGSSALGTVLGGVFVTATPIGWIVGCTAAAGVMGYGVAKLVKSGQKGDSSREKHRNAILERIKAEEKKQTEVYDDFIAVMKTAVDMEVISSDTSLQMIGLVEDGSMDIQIAIDRISRLLAPQT